MPIDKVKVLKEVYPRNNFDNETVNNYLLNIENLPPIVVSHENILIDGYHRLIAHRLAKKAEINVEVIEIPKDRILWEATRLNSIHGRQLTRNEKRRLARRFYRNNGILQKDIAGVLSVSEGTISDWLKDLMREAKEEQKHQIIELYLQCLTHQENSDKIGLSRSRITEIVNKFKSEFSDTPPESLQLFNVWSFPARRDVLKYRGAIPKEIVENVLYYYTEPFDLVVDPMVGSGTTIDVCKAMFRRYLTYDISPIGEVTKKHDIRNGYLKECNNCDLIFLDPPYHDMVFNYFKTVEEFYEFLRQLAKYSYKTVKEKGIVALLMEDMTEKGRYCLSGEAYRYFTDTKFVCIDHISCPLTTQQFNEKQVEKAKETKHLLGRNRDLYVFRKK